MVAQHPGQEVSTRAKIGPICLRADYFTVLSQHQLAEGGKPAAVHSVFSNSPELTLHAQHGVGPT